MKNKRVINILVFIIGIVATTTSLFGILSNSGSGERTFVSAFGEEISLYGKGIYKNDSVSTVSQGIAQDYVTLFLGVGLLLFSLFKYNKGTLKGKLLLLGTLGFFLYTYMHILFYGSIMTCSYFM